MSTSADALSSSSTGVAEASVGSAVAVGVSNVIRQAAADLDQEVHFAVFAEQYES